MNGKEGYSARIDKRIGVYYNKPLIQEIPKSLGEPKTQEEKLGKIPFAFDLQAEYERIHKYGESYRPFFKANAEYYAKESFGKVPKVEYEHIIDRSQNGEVKLRFANGELAEDSYKIPAEDTSFPLWYRRRSDGDVAWTQSLQEKLTKAKVGDRFIDFSPTEFGLSLQERKKWGFGTHSFIRIHEVVIEDGIEKLISRADRNYLDLSEQETLWKKISKKNLPSEGLLGAVEKLPQEFDIGHLSGLVQKLYRETPEARKLKPLGGDQLYKSDQEMSALLSEMETWVERIFNMINTKMSKQSILEEFRGWENAVKAAVQGQKIYKEIFQQLGKEWVSMPQYAYQVPQQIQEFVNQEYKPGMNGCGNGSGFGEISGPFGSKHGKQVKRTSGPMNNQTMTKNERTYNFDKQATCRECGRVEMCGPCDVCEACNDTMDAAELLVAAA